MSSRRATEKGIPIHHSARAYCDGLPCRIALQIKRHFLKNSAKTKRAVLRKEPGGGITSRLSLLVCARPVVPVPAAGLGSRPVLTGWGRGDPSELHQKPPRLGYVTPDKVISVTGRNNLRLGETVKNGFPFLFADKSHKRLISCVYSALCRVIRALFARRGREGVSVYPAPNTRLKRLKMAYLSVV